MSARLAGDFAGSGAKTIIRQKWDLPLLEAAHNRVGRRLTYFGLPGPNIEDLLDWQHLLGTKTGVERLRDGLHRAEDLERIRRLHTNICVHDVEDFQLLRGEIENIILDTLDLDGYMPVLNNGLPLQRMRLRYDVINLDFFGGVGYRDRHGESKRVRALKRLFERQSGMDFILLLTLNVRDGIDDELTDYLVQTRNSSEGRLRRIADWYAACQTVEKGEKEYKLKAVVPLFVKRMAEDWMFHSHAYPAIAYDGSGGARMVHFVFVLTHVPGNLRAFSPQSDGDLLELPLLVASDDGLAIAAKQHVDFDLAVCEEALVFLPDQTRESLIAAALAGVSPPVAGSQ